MLVKELIAHLLTLDPDLPVVTFDHDFVDDEFHLVVRPINAFLPCAFDNSWSYAVSRSDSPEFILLYDPDNYYF